MTAHLAVKRAGPSLSIQDLGRPGFMSVGLSQGGAADRLAMAEGAALLGQDVNLAAIEMAGFGGVFEASHALRIALTGAPMDAKIDDTPVEWSAGHHLNPGQQIAISAVRRGMFGYLHVGGGIDHEPYLGSRSSHFTAGIGKAIQSGSKLAIGPETPPDTGAVRLSVQDRFTGGVVRVSPSAQTDRFTTLERARFEATEFVRTARGNRQGVQLEFGGAPFSAEGQLKILSEIMVPGDIQMTGSGNPYVLLPECQTTGGYPRIGTVLPQDLPIVAQAAPGTRLRFCFVSIEQALETAQTLHQTVSDLQRKIQPLIRDPREIGDLLSYQLISGMTAGQE